MSILAYLVIMPKLLYSRKMRIFTLIILVFYCFSANAQFTPVKVNIVNDLVKYGPDQHKMQKSGPSKPTTCGQDTLQYGRYKAASLRGLTVGKGYALGQYFDAPGQVTISGFSFYGWQSSANSDSVTIICRLYESGKDTIPVGNPIRQTSIKVDSSFSGGQLSVLLKKISFAPYTTNKPFIITVECDDSVNRVAIVVSDWTNNDGDFEWLGCGTVAGVWYNFRNLNVGGVPLNCDVMLEPYVQYNHYADFSFKNCYNYQDSVKFQNKSSAFTFNRMYNRYSYFGLDYICQRWNYGNNPFYYSSVQGGTRYTAAQNYNISLISTVYGYANPLRCEDTLSQALYYQPSQITLVGNTVLCSGDSLDLMALGNAPMHWYRNDADTIAFQIQPRYVSPPLIANDTVYVRSINESCTSLRKRSIGEVKTTPDIPTVTHDYVCLQSKANLTATTNTGIIHWYQDSLSTSPFYTGNLYETSVLAADTHMFVQAVNFNCISAGKVRVSAFVSADFAPVQPVVSTDTSICLLNGQAELRATSSSNDTIRWFLEAAGGSPVQKEGNYTFVPNKPGKSRVYVDAFNGKCASSRIPIEVTTLHFPEIQYLSKTEICEGDTALLNIETGNGDVKWFKNMSDQIPFHIGPVLYDQNSMVTATYYLEPFSGVCSDTLRHPIDIVAHAYGVINTDTSVNACRGRDLSLTASSSAGTINWYGDPDGVLQLGQGNNFIVPGIEGNQTYYLRSIHNGCLSEPTRVKVTTIASTDATFDFQILGWRNVQFLARKGGQGVYRWNFDDAGNTKNGENITYIFTGDGSFNVQLIVENGSGCHDTSYRLITLNTLGLQPELYNNFVVYPNPFQSELNILTDVDFKITITDAQGKVLFHGFNTRKIHEDISSWPNGLYFYQIDAEENVMQGKLIKTH